MVKVRDGLGLGKSSQHQQPKLGSKLGPFAPEYHAKTEDNTQNKPKRHNRLVHRLLVRDQGLGGSNPLSPTI